MGRTILLLIICIATLLLPAGSIFASTVSVRVELDVSAIKVIEDAGGLFRVDAAGMNRTNFLELPSLPYRVVSVLLPQGEGVDLVPSDGRHRGRAGRLGLAGSVRRAGDG